MELHQSTCLRIKGARVKTHLPRRCDLALVLITIQLDGSNLLEADTTAKSSNTLRYTQEAPQRKISFAHTQRLSNFNRTWGKLSRTAQSPALAGAQGK